MVVRVLPVLFFSVVSSGCVETDEQFAHMSNKILSHFGQTYEAAMEFSVGSAGITVSRWVVGMAKIEEPIDSMMRGVSHMQVGIYKKIAEDKNGFDVLRTIEKDMVDGGWKSIIRSCKDGEITAVYVRSRRDEYMKRLFVFSSDDDQLVLVEVEGDLRKLIGTAIRNRRFELRM
jgi:Domain of unknown function (DUF4252)